MNGQLAMNNIPHPASRFTRRSDSEGGHLASQIPHPS